MLCLATLVCCIGASRPFESISARFLNATSFARYLRFMDMPGVDFTEFRSGGHEGSTIKIDPNASANLTALGVYILATRGPIFSGARQASSATFFTRSTAVGRFDCRSSAAFPLSES